MTNVIQGTDAIRSVPMPRNLLKNVTSAFDELETVGSFDISNYQPISQPSLISEALESIQNLEPSSNTSYAKNLLYDLRDIINAFEFSNYYLSDVSPLYAYRNDDGSLMIEWIFDNFRIGFDFEENHEESGWYIVSNNGNGYANASGLLQNSDTDKILLWVVYYILLNS